MLCLYASHGAKTERCLMCVTMWFSTTFKVVYFETSYMAYSITSGTAFRSKLSVIMRNMPLLENIIKRAQSVDSISFNKKYYSPPPELETIEKVVKCGRRKKKTVFKYQHIGARVDHSPPSLDLCYMRRNIAPWTKRAQLLFEENMKLLTLIKRYHFTRGKVDCHWDSPLRRSTKQCEERMNYLRRIQTDNKLIYERIMTTSSKLPPTKVLLEDWNKNRKEILVMARLPFVLFPPVYQEIIEDLAFKAPEGVKRPRVYIELGIRNAASLGSLTVELFTDVCPLTCKLFMELADGDGLGHGYIGTCFFTKVPGIYWSGGDVILNNGFGCYAQRGRTVPIPAENYHFPHSMPGLLSMRMTRNDEMCGVFNITFKPLLQFDLLNVVFGRVVRPSNTYEIIKDLGSPLSTQPVVEIRATRRKENKKWIYGRPNNVLHNYKRIN